MTYSIPKLNLANSRPICHGRDLSANILADKEKLFVNMYYNVLFDNNSENHFN